MMKQNMLSVDAPAVDAPGVDAPGVDALKPNLDAALTADRIAELRGFLRGKFAYNLEDLLQEALLAIARGWEGFQVQDDPTGPGLDVSSGA